MFIIKPKDTEAIKRAIDILTPYRTNYVIASHSEDGVFITVGGGTDERLAEMAFQMNFQQSGERLCPDCKGKVELEDEGAVCGHLTFTTYKGV